jgi:hypothetical protein
VYSFTPLPLYAQGKSPWYSLIGGGVGPRASLNAVVKKKFSAPVGTRIPDHPAHSPALCYLLNTPCIRIETLYIAAFQFWSNNSERTAIRKLTFFILNKNKII